MMQFLVRQKVSFKSEGIQEESMSFKSEGIQEESMRMMRNYQRLSLQRCFFMSYAMKRMKRRRRMMQCTVADAASAANAANGGIWDWENATTAVGGGCLLWNQGRAGEGEEEEMKLPSGGSRVRGGWKGVNCGR